MEDRPIFFTSDTHFGHQNVIKYSNRPFRDKWDMDEQLISRWNAKVPENAIVYHLGDFSFSQPERTLEVANQLNGTIRFIRGNHDRGIKGPITRRFEWIKDLAEVRSPDGRKLVLCHYPLTTWNQSHRGSWMLHGHCHGNLRAPASTRLDVGVDTHGNYEPYSWEEIDRILSKRKYDFIDHHE